MLSRRERLPRAQFASALKTGKRFSSPHFMVVVPKGLSGYAVVIPKKVMRLSVARHRLKRQIMEALRELSLPPAMIVFPRAITSSVNYQDVKTELSELISTIRI